MEVYSEEGRRASNEILSDRLRDAWRPRIAPSEFDHWGVEPLRPGAPRQYLGGDVIGSPTIQPGGKSDRFVVPGGESFANDFFGGDFFQILPSPSPRQGVSLFNRTDGDTVIAGQDFELPTGGGAGGDSVYVTPVAPLDSGAPDPDQLLLVNEMLRAAGGLENQDPSQFSRGGAVIQIGSMITDVVIEPQPGPSTLTALVFRRKIVEVGLAVTDATDGENVIGVPGPGGETTQIVFGVHVREVEEPSDPEDNDILIPLYECPDQSARSL